MIGVGAPVNPRACNPRTRDDHRLPRHCHRSPLSPLPARSLPPSLVSSLDTRSFGLARSPTHPRAPSLAHSRSRSLTLTPTTAAAATAAAGYPSVRAWSSVGSRPRLSTRVARSASRPVLFESALGFDVDFDVHVGLIFGLIFDEKKPKKHSILPPWNADDLQSIGYTQSVARRPASDCCTHLGVSIPSPLFFFIFFLPSSLSAYFALHFTALCITGGLSVVLHFPRPFRLNWTERPVHPGRKR